MRAFQHRRAIETWEARASAAVVDQVRATRFEFITGIDELHDLPRLIGVLGEYSDHCRTIALEARDLPRRLADERTLGEPLGRTLPFHDVEPPEARLLWLTERQSSELRRAVEAAERRSTGPADDTEPLHFIGRRGAALRFSHLGDTFEVGGTPDLADVVFDPVAAGLAANGVVKMLSFPQHGLPWWVAASCGALELGAAAATGVAGERGRRPAVALSTAAALAWLLAVRSGLGRELRDNGEPVHPATPGTAMLGVLAHYWSRLSPIERSIGPAIVLLWVEAMRSRRSSPSVGRWMSEGTTMAQYFVGTFRLLDRTEEERAQLEEHLQHRLEHQLAEVERRTRGEELARHESLLTIGRDELAAARNAGDLPFDLDNYLESEFDRIDRWLAGVRHEHGDEVS